MTLTLALQVAMPQSQSHAISQHVRHQQRHYRCEGYGDVEDAHNDIPF
jgi:hypothetical protein